MVSGPADDLKRTNLILREKGTRIRRDMAAWLGKFDRAFLPKRYIELENVVIAKKLVGEGFGMTMIPKIAVQQQLDSGQFKALDLPRFNLSAYYYLYYPRHRRLSQAASELLTLMLETIPLSHGENLNIKALE